MDQVRPDDEPSIREAGERVRDDLERLREAAERRRAQLLGELQRLVAEHPLGAVAAAFGVGYLLSGALLSRTTARVLGIGARIYLGQMVRGGLGEQLLGAFAGEAPSPTGGGVGSA
jgi:hypothetical protein